MTSSHLTRAVLGLVMSKMTSATPYTHRVIPDYTTAEAGNPFVEGWYADPDTEYYNGSYWIYPTYSDDYEKQTYMDAFSSTDLIHWTKHPNILTTANVSWATKALWAPAAISRNGKYYLYFSANDLQEDEAAAGVVGGIGVAVADRPEGPYVDALGEPLIGDYHNGAQPIDQDVFIDDDGQAYIYYGGHSYANVAKLNEDMVSLGDFDDGSTFRNITPENYVEGSQMFKRAGVYYFMWSEGGWTGPDYSVSYSMADNPLGPFPRVAKILQQDLAVASGSGHNGVIRVPKPEEDVYYIVYHRRPLSEADGNHRVLCYDRMYFDESDGTIRQVAMLVKDNFADNNTIGWTMSGGTGSTNDTTKAVWSVVDRRLIGSVTSVDGKGRRLAMLDTNFGDLVYDGLVTPVEGRGPAGLVFRAGDKTTAGGGGYGSYYAATIEVGIGSLEGTLTLESVRNGSVAAIKSAVGAFTHGTEYHVRVRAIGSDIQVFVDDLEHALITAQDTALTTGANGVVVGADATAKFGKISVAHP